MATDRAAAIEGGDAKGDADGGGNASGSGAAGAGGGVSSPEVWACNVAMWEPSVVEWERCLALVQPEERERVGRFVRVVDRKRALIGRLLVRSLLCQRLGITNAELSLARTKEGRPVLAADSISSPPCSTDFNMTHHGDWVAATATNGCLVGLDVMTVEIPRGETSFRPFFKSMMSASVYTAAEWATIEDASVRPGPAAAGVARPKRSDSDIDTDMRPPAGSDALRLELFYWHWTLKEAYIKAKGIGLGFPLMRAELSFPGDANGPSVKLQVDGEHVTKWRFLTSRLDATHIVALAHAPVSEAVDSLAAVVESTAPRCTLCQESESDTGPLLFTCRLLAPLEMVAMLE